jgi:hypothetical protein
MTQLTATTGWASEPVSTWWWQEVPPFLQSDPQIVIINLISLFTTQKTINYCQKTHHIFNLYLTCLSSIYIKLGLYHDSIWAAIFTVHTCSVLLTIMYSKSVLHKYCTMHVTYPSNLYQNIFLSGNMHNYRPIIHPPWHVSLVVTVVIVHFNAVAPMLYQMCVCVCVTLRC